jgi:ketosteroid isomerase-like protein
VALLSDIDRLLIERACDRLVQEYCHWTDHGEAARVADLFTEDAVWTSADNTMSGRDAIRRGFTIRQNNRKRMSRHVCTGLLLDIIDQSTAHGVVYLTLYRHDGDPERRTSPTQAPSMIGEYRDEFVRTADGWRFRRREIRISFVGGDKVYAGEV